MEYWDTDLKFRSTIHCSCWYVLHVEKKSKAQVCHIALQLPVVLPTFGGGPEKRIHLRRLGWQWKIRTIWRSIYYLNVSFGRGRWPKLLPYWQKKRKTSGTNPTNTQQFVLAWKMFMFFFRLEKSASNRSTPKKELIGKINIVPQHIDRV